MKIIVPMAGRGSRLRPHTLTIPKPLIPVGGKPIVHRLVEDIAALCTEPIESIGFVVGEFGQEVEQELIKVAEQLGAKGHIFYQKEPLGTAHAVMCAEPLLNGKVVVAFADTLFKADFKIDSSTEGVLWVKQIENPSDFGVVKMNENNEIIDFVEKPQTFVSDLAMIGAYYFQKGEDLKTEIRYLIENKIIKSGEYQLPDALRRLTEKGVRFIPGKVDEWLDCGNKNVTVHTNQRVLDFDYKKGLNLVDATAKIENSTIIPPCFIGENASIENSVIGPYVSVGSKTKIQNSIIKNTLIQSNSSIENANLIDSMIGNYATINKKAQDLSVGDYTHTEA